MDYSNKYKYASALWKIGLTFFLISILFLTPLTRIIDGHVDSVPFVLTYSYMFFEGGFRSIINSDFFAVQYIFAAASLFALFAVYHCNNLSYAGGEKLPILPILAFLIGIGIVFYLCEEPTYKTRIIPLYNKKIVEIIYLRINWMDYWVWMISLLCILSSSLLQCSIKHDEAEALIKAQNEKLTRNENYSFFSQMLGGTPDTLQKIYICLMVLSLIPWFIATCMIVLIHSEYGFDYYFKDWITMLYPITTFLLMKLMFRMSVRWKKRWIFFLVPLVGILLKDISLIF